MKYNIKYKMCVFYVSACTCPRLHFLKYLTPVCNSAPLYASIYSCIVILRWFIEFFWCFFNVIMISTLSLTRHYYYPKPLSIFSCWLLLLLLLSSFLVTGFLSFLLLLPLSQWWTPPLRLQVSACSTFLMMCDVPSMAVFWRESTELLLLLLLLLLLCADCG
jgi:hypothetical protein